MAWAHSGGDTAPVRTLALWIALVPSLTLADEIDLSRASARGDPGAAATWVVRAEAGNDFAPYGYVGGCVSYLLDPHDVLELGAGGGFPGLQLGFAARRLFGEGEQHFLAELFLAGNTRVDRAADNQATLPGERKSSLWTGLGFGFEQRSGLFSLSVAGNIVFASTSFTPHWSVHGGVGIGF